MRLIDADALKSKIREQPWKRETKVSLILEWIYTLIDEASTVQNEALQQENEQLQAQLDEWKYEAKCHMDEVIAREKQIEQLRAQVARMREVLEQFKYDYEQNYPMYQNYLAVCQLLREDTVQAYHNPADVAEAQKIPLICYYERNEDGAWTYECRKDQSGCPKVCPKYRGEIGGKEDA